MANYTCPTQKDIAKFYVQGKTKDEILKFYMVDDNQTDIGTTKQEARS